MLYDNYMPMGSNFHLGVSKIMPKIVVGGLACDVRIYFSLCSPQELEIYRQILAKKVFTLLWLGR